MGWSGFERRGSRAAFWLVIVGYLLSVSVVVAGAGQKDVEDFYTTCFNLGPAYSRGRGVVTGTATIAKKGVLDATTELICISDLNVPHSLGVATVQYTLRPRTLRSRERVLVLPAFGSSPAIVLHRVAP